MQAYIVLPGARLGSPRPVAVILDVELAPVEEPRVERGLGRRLIPRGEINPNALADHGHGPAVGPWRMDEQVGDGGVVVARPVESASMRRLSR